MRSALLSLPSWSQPFFIVGATIVAAFLLANFVSVFFDAHQLAANTDLTSAVYQVIGTLYAILLTFTLWGIWQSFTDAEHSVQEEAFALIDLVHTIEASPEMDGKHIRQTAFDYCKEVIEQEWATLNFMTKEILNTVEKTTCSTNKIVTVVQGINPRDPREVAIFSQTLTMLNHWLDARRTRILCAEGNRAKALWPLLLSGALVLFGIHGLFIAKTAGIWVALLFGLSLIIGLTFYLIFSLDCPFTGSLSIDSEPFKFALNALEGNTSEEYSSSKSFNKVL